MSGKDLPATSPQTHSSGVSCHRSPSVTPEGYLGFSLTRDYELVKFILCTSLMNIICMYYSSLLFLLPISLVILLFFDTGIVVTVNSQFSSLVIDPRHQLSIFFARCQVITLLIVAFCIYQCLQKLLGLFLLSYYKRVGCLVANYLCVTQFNAMSCVSWRLVVDEPAFLLVKLILCLP